MKLFDSMMPTGTLIKQFLRGAGVRDPQVLSMVDTLTEGGFEAPVIESVSGGTIDVPDDGSAVRVTCKRPGAELTLILLRRNVVDIAPNPVHPDSELEVVPEGRLLKA